MRNKTVTSGNYKTNRQKFLESPVHILPLPRNSGKELGEMGFKTVREAFRAALVGRISSRRNGGAALENAVLTSGCTALGHPVLTKSDIRDFQILKTDVTVADAIFRFNGRRVRLSRELLATSTRKILLPTNMHRAIEKRGVKTLAELLETRISHLLDIAGIKDHNLGLFLAHVFDFVFIINDQDIHSDDFGPEVIRSLAPDNRATDNSSQLSSWLRPEMYQAGIDLLHNSPPEVLLFFRETAGAIFRDGDQTGLACLALTGGHDTAREIGPHATCELCPPAFDDQSGQCPHLAALAIRIMGRDQGHDGTETSPLLFNESPWYVIGRIAYELFGHGGAEDTTIKKQGKNWLMTIPGADRRPWATWLLDRKSMDHISALFGGKYKWLAGESDQNSALIEALWRKLLDLGRTTAEIDLNSFGKCSIDQNQDESIWMWLASNLAREIAPADIQVTGPENDGLFHLSGRSSTTGQEIFTMILPRAKTPDLIDALPRSGSTAMLLPAARALTKIALGEKGEMVVSSLLKLADGRTINRHELQGEQYGKYYYLAGQGFLPIVEQETDHRIALDTKYDSTSFHANNVPELLIKYHQVITAPENDIDHDLLDLDYIEMPDRLAVSSFATDDDWCYLSGHYGLGTRNISLVELLASRIGKNRFLPEGKSWLKLTDSPLEWFHNLGEERLWRDEQTGSQGVRLTRREMIMLSAMIPNLELDQQTRGTKQLKELIDFDDWQEGDTISGIPAHLRDYQLHGISWLYHLYRNKLAGILADDMGLGKTHQALGLLNLIINKEKAGKFLIVCPATVVPHWVEKIDDFFPDLSHYVYHGSRRDLEMAEDSNIFITTYGIIRRDTKTLSDLEFDVIIFDEIQNMKNRKTDVYKAAVKLKGAVNIGMTGTPLENSVHDLKSIFDICLPGYLGNNREFKARYIDPLETEEASLAQRNLARLINPFMLRRTREQVLKELPDVIEDIRTCELSDDQVSLYRELTSGRVRTIMQMLLSADEDSSHLPYMELLAVINYLKQICDHPCLIKKCQDPTEFRSGKWDLFVELLNECLESGMKVVVFSHYTRMLDLIETHLRDNDIPFCGLRGNMPIGRRHEMIRKFNTDDSCRVFSASLLAGGVGVDLTAAQAVIHYDRWWNAAREDQATARVHRMGQKNVVQVFKMVTVGTLEEKINKMIIKKKTLANHLVKQDDAAIIKKLSREELIDLLSDATIH